MADAGQLAFCPNRNGGWPRPQSWKPGLAVRMGVCRSVSDERHLLKHDSCCRCTQHTYMSDCLEFFCQDENGFDIADVQAQP